jgi:TolB-like protein
MGVVYAARDERLGRLVALKTIRPSSTDPDAKARLWREARAAASVNHPHVCGVYEIGEVEGEIYVAMEHLEGETLAERLRRGALPLREAATVALEVLAALEAMHALGIVHRDLKPANVFLTSRGAKVLDFGLALPAADPLALDADRLTLPGTLLGTPGYMAPEQFTGETAGPTADLFALGSILFELAAGRPAFTGRTVLDVYHAVAHEQPPALTGGPAALALDRVIRRALGKVPSERYANAAEMAAALREAEEALQGEQTVSVRTVKRVLVLPFRLLRPDPDIDFLAQALPDAVVATLAGRAGVVVRAAGAAKRRPEEPEPDLATLAAAASADSVVTGSLLRGGERLRVACQLVAAASGDVVWSDTLDAPVRDLFAVQDEIARRVAQALSPAPPPSRSQTPPTGVTPRPPASPGAYEAYLRANQLAFNTSQLARARDLYRAALAEDPRYAPAWARLGRVYRVMAKYGQAEPEATYKLAGEAFARALELDPELPATHNLFTYYEIEELGQARAAMTRLLTRARARPDDPDLFSGLVTALRFCGLLDASVEADRRARSLDPGMRTSVTYTHLLRGDLERAMRYEDQDVPYVSFYALPLLGRTGEAIDLLRATEARCAEGLQRLMLVTIRAALEGQVEPVRAGLARLNDSGFHDPEGLYLTGRHAQHVGLTDTWLTILERVVARGFHVPSTMRADPWLVPLRGNARFEAALREADEGVAASARAYVEGHGEALLGAGATAPEGGPEPQGAGGRA